MPNNRLFDNLDPTSVVGRLRRKRFLLFESLISRMEKPISILDVGGEQGFWNTMLRDGSGDLKVTILNRVEQNLSPSPNFTSVVGDACDLHYEDKSFEVVFSNSVIEHVGKQTDQIRMAHEIRRVGRRYIVQTPNRYFPIEPHFLFPFFQFFPSALKVGLLRRFDLGWYKRTRDYHEAKLVIERESARLLDRKEFLSLVPRGLALRRTVLGYDEVVHSLRWLGLVLR